MESKERQYEYEGDSCTDNSMDEGVKASNAR